MSYQNEMQLYHVLCDLCFIVKRAEGSYKSIDYFGSCLGCPCFEVPVA